MIQRYSLYYDDYKGYDTDMIKDNNGEYVKYEDIKQFIRKDLCINKYFVSSTSSSPHNSSVMCYDRYNCKNCTSFREKSE